MIFGHLGVAFLLKSKFYKRSLIILIPCCFIPDIIYFLFYGIQYIIVSNYPSIYNGLLGWILNLSGAEITITNIKSSSMAFSHSIILYVIFLSFFLIYSFIHGRTSSRLIYVGAILGHLGLDILLLDHLYGVFPLFPFEPTLEVFPPQFFLPLFNFESAWFWIIDLSIFAAGFFVLLWAFSKYEGSELEIYD